jgi:drug/metabolite transporter (DMT)-like permease
MKLAAVCAQRSLFAREDLRFRADRPAIQSRLGNRASSRSTTSTRGKTLNRMKDSPALHLKTYIFIVFIAIFAPLGNVLLSKGMKSVGSARNWQVGELFSIVIRVLSSGYIWLGIACLLAFFVAYMLILTWADYSYVQPASAFSYAVVAILGLLLLGEKVNLLRWAGIAVICLGVLIVGRTPPRTTEKA